MGGMGSFWVGTSGLQTSQNAINVTANNLANLNTTGYVRQQVLQADRDYRTLSTTPAIANQQSGLGVTIAEVTHTRDVFLDKYYRTENGRQSFYNTLSDATSEVETVFQELEGQQFEAVLDDFQQAFDELAKDPSSSVNQNLVIQKASSFISRAQAVMTSLTEYQANLNQQTTDMVDTINGLGDTIASLNQQIAKIEAGGVETAYDLRDQRDNALDELSTYVKIDYKELSDTTVTVSIEGTEFVEGTRVNELQATEDAATGFVNPTWENLSDYDSGNITYLYDLTNEVSTDRNTDIGKLKALVLARGDDTANYLDSLGLSGISSDLTDSSVLMTVESQLDTLVNSVTTQINNIFSPLTSSEDDITIYLEDGTTSTISAGTQYWDEENGALGSDMTGPGQELFSRLFTNRYTTVTGYTDAAKTNAVTYYVYNEPDATDSTSLYTLSNIQVNTNLTKDGTLLPYQYSTGDVAQTMGSSLSSLWNTDIDELGGSTFVEYYSSIINGVATAGNVYSGMSTTLSSTVSSIVSKRNEVLAVSSDEELSNMVRYQSAYNAASRYINVIDEMMETIVTSL